MGLPEVVLFEVFKYLKTAELIDASAVCEKWRSVIWNGVFSEKLTEKVLIGLSLKFTGSVFLFCRKQLLILLIMKFKECFMEFFLIAYGFISVFVVGLN